MNFSCLLLEAPHAMMGALVPPVVPHGRGPDNPELLSQLEAVSLATIARLLARAGMRAEGPPTSGWAKLRGVGQSRFAPAIATTQAWVMRGPSSSLTAA